MALLALFCLVAGVLWGVFGPDLAPVELLVNNADLVLNLLMLLVGVSVGMHRGLLDRLRQYHIKVLIIPFGVVAGSILGGFAAGLLLGFRYRLAGPDLDQDVKEGVRRAADRAGRLARDLAGQARAAWARFQDGHRKH